MDVVYPDDMSYVDFQKDVLSRTAFYILIWPWQTISDGKRYVYIGQTGNGAERIKQHIKAGRKFECACIFTAVDEEFTRSEVMYLEYIAIIQTIEQGTANMIDNCQIPKRPSIKSADISKLSEIFDTIQKLTAFAGYHIFSQKKFICSDDIGTRRTLKRRLTEEYAKMCPDSTDVKNNIYMLSSFDNDCLDDVEEEMIKYVAKGDDWSAECIPMKDKFFIMPNSTIDSLAVPMIVSEEKVSDNQSEYVDYINRKIPRGMTVETLEQAAEIVCGRPDESIWKIVRTIL